MSEMILPTPPGVTQRMASMVYQGIAVYSDPSVTRGRMVSMQAPPAIFAHPQDVITLQCEGDLIRELVMQQRYLLAQAFRKFDAVVNAL